jgi:hypothetical protein
MAFHTYYWHGSPMGDPELERARAELSEPSNAEAFESAFLALLRSGWIPAIGTALDHYDYADSTSRYGSRNALAAHADEVREQARNLLRGPPLPAEAVGASEDGANHASALGALANLAEPEDADLVADAVTTATTPSVSSAATSAARTVLERSDQPSVRLIGLLGSIAADPNVPTDERIAALRALGGAKSTDAEDLVLRAIGSDDLDLQVNAALLLAHHNLDRHRALLENVAGNWPEHPPYPADDVLDLLHGEEDR